MPPTNSMHYQMMQLMKHDRKLQPKLHRWMPNFIKLNVSYKNSCVIQCDQLRHLWQDIEDHNRKKEKASDAQGDKNATSRKRPPGGAFTCAIIQNVIKARYQSVEATLPNTVSPLSQSEQVQLVYQFIREYMDIRYKMSQDSPMGKTNLSNGQHSPTGLFINSRLSCRFMSPLTILTSCRWPTLMSSHSLRLPFPN